jgi:hypothetical protein
MKMEQTECSETSAYKIKMPGSYPEENIQRLGEPYISLASVRLHRVGVFVVQHTHWEG